MKTDSVSVPKLGKVTVQTLQCPLSFSFLLCGSLIIGTAQPSWAAGGEPTRAEFRDLHPDLTKRDARQLYRSLYGRGATGGAQLPIDAFTPKQIQGNSTNHGTTPFNVENRARHNRDFRAVQHGRTMQTLTNEIVPLKSGVNLDLTSTEQNIVLGGNLFKNAGSVEIKVGDETRTLQAGSQVTAAEYIAVKQVLSGVGQKVVVGNTGTATGGTIDLSEITSNNDRMRAADFVNSSGVTTYGDFGKRSDFKLLGDLTNYGSIFALSSDKRVKGGIIAADDITNQQGALISSVLPDNFDPRNFAPSVDLSLNADGSLSNYGTISSSGNLNLTGSSVTNAGLASANNSIYVVSAATKNSGRIEALAGNINLDGPATAALDINNTGGVLAALNGAINVRTPEYTGTNDNFVNGGDLLSKQVNIYGGNGTNYVNVNQLTGTVNQTGNAGHLIAATDTLTLGGTCFTGDPTFFNTTGNISITGNLSAAEALTIIAFGNITSANGVTIEARSATTGFDITLIAGANITGTTGGSDSTTLPGTGSAGSVTLDGTATPNGGLIFLGTNNNIITSPTTGGTGPGGNVNIYAFKGASSTSGIVDIDGTTITTGGVGTAANGNVTIIAGGTNGGLGSAIQIGNMNTAGGTGGGGNLTIVTAQPESSGGSITYNADGTLAAGAQLVAGSTLTATADIAMIGVVGVPVIATVGGDVTLRAGEDIGQTNGAALFTNNVDADVVLEAGANIGSGLLNPFIIQGFNQLLTKKVLKKNPAGNGNLTVAAGGQADIRRDASTNLNLLASSATNGLALFTNSFLNVAGNVSSSNGLVRLENAGGSLNIEDGVQITASTVIDITNGSPAKVKPTFTVGANAQLTTTSIASPGIGDIFLTLDKKAFSVNSFSFTNAHKRTPPPPTFAEPEVTGFRTYANVAVTENNGGTVKAFGKKNGFLGLPPNNQFTANGAKIEITFAGRKEAMLFEGGVITTAGQ